MTSIKTADYSSNYHEDNHVIIQMIKTGIMSLSMCFCLIYAMFTAPPVPFLLLLYNQPLTTILSKVSNPRHFKVKALPLEKNVQSTPHTAEISSYAGQACKLGATTVKAKQTRLN